MPVRGSKSRSKIRVKIISPANEAEVYLINKKSHICIVEPGWESDAMIRNHLSLVMREKETESLMNVRLKPAL